MRPDGNIKSSPSASRSLWKDLDNEGPPPSHVLVYLEGKAWISKMDEIVESAISGKLHASNTHIAGEMFVAAELAKRGYNVSLTMGNAKAVDLFAERDGRSICVQVKAISHKRNVGWPLPFDKRKIIDHVVFVCVVLNDVGEQCTYYVLPPDEVRQRGKWYETSGRAILNVGAAKDFEAAWHLIDRAMSTTSIT